MNGKNQRPPVTDAPVEFEECLVEGRDFKKFNHHSRGICGIYLKLVKKNGKIASCNRLDLETLGF